MTKKRSKYYIWALFLLCLTAFVIYYHNVFSTNYYPELSKIEKNFSSKEKQLDDYLNEISVQLKQNTDGSEIEKDNSPFLLHIYKNDTLFYWNTNKLPVSKFADLHFPTSGIKHTQNGWYFVKTIEQGAFSISGSFLIKREYAYQNAYLKNGFDQSFNGNFQSYISLDEATGFPIYSNNNHYLFSIVVNDYQPATETESLLLMGLLLGAVFLLLWQISRFLQFLESKWVWLFPLSVFILRYLSLQFSWFAFMQHTELFQASLYGTSFVFPNFFEYTLNSLLIFILVQFAHSRLKRLTNRYAKLVAPIFLVSLYLMWTGAVYLFKGLIENSSIPMHIEALFRLNTYSVIAVFSMAVIGFSLFIIGKSVVQYIKKSNHSIVVALLLNAFIGTIYFFSEFLFLNKLFFAGLFPLLFISLIILLEYKQFQQKHLITGMGMLVLYAFVCSLTIGEFNNRKDKSERELYANQLVTERDIATELEYNNLVKSIADDKFLQRMISSGNQFIQRDFEEIMERRHFNGFWERYECAFYLFDENLQSLLSIQGNSTELYESLSQLIAQNGEQSEINTAVYFIKNYKDQYSYVIRQGLYGKNGESANLFITLKSKKIPEEIGFPRLLLSSQSSALRYLENYSVAKYHRNKLVSQYGKFNYPTTLTALKKVSAENQNNFDYNGYNHFIHYKSGKDAVILSGVNTTWIDDITSFSYLFCFFGLLLLPIYVRFYANSFFRKSLALSAKIQVTLIGIVVVSLIISGTGSGLFVKNQYTEYAAIEIKDKIYAVEIELKSKVGKLQSLNIQENGDLLNHQLLQLSKTFKTDINFYDTDGFLIGTSRRKVFNMGLLSEQINAQAKKELAELEQSEFVHKENIGSLDYNSAYAPFFNNSGKLLGYINLQHFGQYEAAQLQIQQFLVSVINIFVLLLAISAVVAIFAGNWITNPLRMLQERFATIHLGQSNQRIFYSQDDEIGALVKSYNQKIEELEIAAQQLALSERESAWRDMAKQVAHEIKNPLTPMKLSVQHLMRSFDPADERSQEKIQKVSHSLIEQIDALTNIANEFSNFAKMPKPLFDSIDLVQIILNSTELFKRGTDTLVNVQLPDSCFVKGDKEQLLRVFNNLIKNSLQATVEKDNGRIQITAKTESEITNGKNELKVIVTVSDNGIGMSEMQKQKIFTPYFTTKSTGSGIGLAMVKQIILNHGGDIYFKSKENEGTDFIIELPCETTI